MFSCGTNSSFKNANCWIPLRDLWIPWIREFALTPTSFFILIWDWLLRALTGAGWGYERLVIWFVRWVYFHLSWKLNHTLWLLYLKAHEGSPTRFHASGWDWFSTTATSVRSYLWLWMLLWFFLFWSVLGARLSSCAVAWAPLRHVEYCFLTRDQTTPTALKTRFFTPDHQGSPECCYDFKFT